MGEQDGSKPMMREPRESTVSFAWVVIVILLMVGIDGLLTRVLESLWVSLRARNSPAYLPLEWWMSAPFTIFVFVVLSALLSSFSGVRNWLKTFLLLCVFKVIFSGVTAFSFFYRPYPDVMEAASQATLLSLPSVLVHILLSGIIVMLLRDLFAVQVTTEEAPFPPEEPAEEVAAEILAPEAAFEEEEPVAPVMEEEAPSILAEAPEEVPATVAVAGAVLLPVREVLRCFPRSELALPPSEIEELLPSVEIPLEVILPQLCEGKVEVEARTVISGMPSDAFANSPEEVARKFPEGMIELPLREVVCQIPPAVFEPPQQELQPDVDLEFPDPFKDESVPPPEQVAEKPAAAVEERLEKAAPVLEEVLEAAREVSEEDLVVREEERVLFERSRDVVEVSLGSILSQFPVGALASGDLPHPPDVPDSIVVPLRFIIAQLAHGEARLHVKYVLAQFPEGCLSISELDILRSLPNGELELPLNEIVPQLPPELLAPPEQIQQPDLAEMPDPFCEKAPPPPLEEEEVGPPSVEEEPQPIAVAAAPELEEPSLASYTALLDEENPLTFSVDTVVSLLPEGSFRKPAEELKHHLDGETVKVPRSMVMGQLKEGRVVVPVEILTLQFVPEHLGMSVEQIKARFAEGLVELPLKEVVGQVLSEVAQPLEGQELQPECEEISSPFGQILAESLPETEAAPIVSEPEGETVPSEVPGTGTPVTVGAKTAVQRSVEPYPVRGVTAQKEIVPAKVDRTILRTLLQKCSGLGVSEHVSFAAGGSSAVVLAPSSLNREAVACGMVEMMAQLTDFSINHSLGHPFKLVVYSTDGAIVGGQLARGNATPLVVLASLNRSGAGLMSLLLDRFETQLRDLASLTASELKATPVERAVTFEPKRMPLKPDGMPEQVCRQVLAVMGEVGMENYLSATIASDQKLVAVWGEGGHGDTMRDRGLFDADSLSRYCSDAGVGELESLLLVTDNAKVTLNKAPALWAYLLCFFSGKYAEGLVRAKAEKAVKLLEPRPVP